jgi:hypothetical protein
LSLTIFDSGKSSSPSEVQSGEPLGTSIQVPWQHVRHWLLN